MSEHDWTTAEGLEDAEIAVKALRSTWYAKIILQLTAALRARAAEIERLGKVGEGFIRELSLLRTELAALRAENVRLTRASRTRSDYDLRCDDCGAPHWLDTVIPSELWNKHIRQSDGSEPLLCMLCIDERLNKAGVTCDRGEFYFVGSALSSRLYANDELVPVPLGNSS